MIITICGNDECINSNPMFCAACGEVEQEFRREVGEAWFHAALAAAQDYKAEVAVESDFRAYHGGRLYSCSMGGVTVTGLPEKAACGVSEKIRAAGEAAAREAVETIQASLSETEA